LSLKKGNVERHFDTFSHWAAQAGLGAAGVAAAAPSALKNFTTMNKEQHCQRFKAAYFVAKNPTCSFALSAKMFCTGRAIFSDPIAAYAADLRESVDQFTTTFDGIKHELGKMQAQTERVTGLVPPLLSHACLYIPHPTLSLLLLPSAPFSPNHHQHIPQDEVIEELLALSFVEGPLKKFESVLKATRDTPANAHVITAYFDMLVTHCITRRMARVRKAKTGVGVHADESTDESTHQVLPDDKFSLDSLGVRRDPDATSDPLQFCASFC
jgi:hypothetical protein